MKFINVERKYFEIKSDGVERGRENWWNLNGFGERKGEMNNKLTLKVIERMFGVK